MELTSGYSLDNDILTQYKNLHETGTLSSMENLKQENKELNRIVNDTFQLISFTDVNSMISYLITKFLDYFVPESLIFLIKPPRRHHVRHFVYKRLEKQIVNPFSTDYFQLFKDYFDEFADQDLSGVPFEFTEILEKTGRDSFGNDFLSTNTKLVIPLIGIGGMYGVVFLSGKITNRPYTDVEISYIHRMFSILAITIQNGLHYETSITDPKTGLYTYDFFLTRMNETLATLQRYHSTGGMLMIDIDFFKRFNDTWGHLTGDKILVALAKCLKNSVRSEDVVARFGGEEFSILLTQCTPESVFQVAERIRLAASEIVIFEQDQPLTITISIGACIIGDQKGLIPKYVFKKADQALYISKETGRNRTTVTKLGLLDCARLHNKDYGLDEEAAESTDASES